MRRPVERLLCLSLAVGGCEANAAGPVERGEAATTRAHAASVDGLVEQQALVEMTPLSVVEVELEAATDPAPVFAPDWRMPAHEPGELPRWIEHQTVARETIEEIALRYDVQPERIREWNELGDDEQPRAWKPEPLRIFARRYPPPRELVEHVVAPGDSWGSIARRYGVDYRALRSWNVGEIGRSLELDERARVWVDPTVFDAIVHDHPASSRAALVRPGAHGVGTPQAGALVAGVQIPPGEGYSLRYPKSAYGTTWAVRQTVAALDQFVQTSGYPRPISVGTMSRQRGGEIGGHMSHQSGRDLDIRLPLRPEVPPALNPTPRRVDWTATWALVRAFADTGAVQIIFLDFGSQRRLYRAARDAGVSEDELGEMLQYPRGSKVSQGLVRHAPGHEGHIHVRFSCGPAEPTCAQ